MRFAKPSQKNPKNDQICVFFLALRFLSDHQLSDHQYLDQPFPNQCRESSFPDQLIEIEASLTSPQRLKLPRLQLQLQWELEMEWVFFYQSRNGGVSICIKTFAIPQNITSTFTYLLCLGRGKCRSEKVQTSMLWSGKLFIVRVTVDANAMVEIDVDSGNRHSSNRRSGKRCSAFFLFKCLLYKVVYQVSIFFPGLFSSAKSLFPL